MLVPQGYDLEALKPIGHLLTVQSPFTNIGFTLLLEVGVITASYIPG
ncbi:hypothetical protein ACW0KB_11015 [Virgibacillus salarius]